MIPLAFSMVTFPLTSSAVAGGVVLIPTFPVEEEMVISVTLFWSFVIPKSPLPPVFPNDQKSTPPAKKANAELLPVPPASMTALAKLAPLS